MSTKDEAQMDAVLEEIFSMAPSSWDTESDLTPTLLALRGFQQSLHREEAQTTPLLNEDDFQRLLQHPHNQPRASQEHPAERALYYMGFGFLYGLRQSKQISARLHTRLLQRLQQETTPDNSPDTPNTPEKTDDILDAIFAPDDTPSRVLLRQRASLVQMMRKHPSFDWRALRQALYEPDQLSPQARQELLQQTKSLLQPEEYDTLQQLAEQHPES